MSDPRRIGLPLVVVALRRANVAVVREPSHACHVAVRELEGAGNRGVAQRVRRELAPQNVAAPAAERVRPAAQRKALGVLEATDATELHEQRSGPDAAHLAHVEPAQDRPQALAGQALDALVRCALAQDPDPPLAQVDVRDVDGEELAAA